MNAFYYPLMSNNINREDINVLVSFLQQDPIAQLTNGPKVKEFEQTWSKWLGVKYSAFVNSGSSSNILTLLAIKELYKNEQNEIIVPPLCWVSDVSSILHAGFKPVFCDINLNNLSYDLNKLKRVVTPKTKAIISVSVLGLNCYSKEFFKICKDNNLLVIGDHCESHGATFNNIKLGGLKNEFVSNFSFFMAHHATTIEGGMICTNHEAFYDYIRSFRSHSMVRELDSEDRKEGFIKNHPDLNRDFIFLAPGYNFRSTEINAVLGLSQLKKLGSNNKIRQKNFSYFIARLDSNKYYTSFDLDGQCNYAFIVILKKPDMATRDLVEKTLTQNGIEFRRGLSGGGSQIKQPYIKNLNLDIDESQFPNVEHVHHFSWYIGNYPTLEREKIDKLLSVLNNINV